MGESKEKKERTNSEHMMVREIRLEREEKERKKKEGKKEIK